MSEIRALPALKRDRAGKGAARAARREGFVPGVIYGGGKTPETIQISEHWLTKELHTGRFLATLYVAELNGAKTRVIPRDVQYHPVTDRPLHVDLFRMAKGARTDVEVAVRFLNEEESPGLRRGGTLNIVRHEVELNVPVDAIPEYLEADLTGLDIGDGVHISDIKLPEGVRPTITDRDFTIATVVAPSVMEVEEPEEAEEGEEAEGEEAAAEVESETEEGSKEEGGGE